MPIVNRIADLQDEIAAWRHEHSRWNRDAVRREEFLAVVLDQKHVLALIDLSHGVSA